MREGKKESSTKERGPQGRRERPVPRNSLLSLSLFDGENRRSIAPHFGRRSREALTSLHLNSADAKEEKARRQRAARAKEKKPIAIDNRDRRRRRSWLFARPPLQRKLSHLVWPHFLSLTCKTLPHSRCSPFQVLFRQKKSRTIPAII